MAFATYAACSERSTGWYYGIGTAFTLALALVDFHWRAASAYRKDIFYLLAMCIFFLLYALVNNGWGYTYNPLFSIILLVVAAVWLECNYLKTRLIHPKELHQLTFTKYSCITILIANGLLIVGFYSAMLTYTCPPGARCGIEKALLNEVKKGDDVHPFGTISIDFPLWVSLSRQGVPWVTRFHHLWMLPKFLGAEPAFTRSHEWILRYVSSGLAEDLNGNKPETVFVDNADVFFTVHKHVDLIAYLSAFPDFKNAWQNYTYAYSIDYCTHGIPKMNCKYDIYQRKAYVQETR